MYVIYCTELYMQYMYIQFMLLISTLTDAPDKYS